MVAAVKSRVIFDGGILCALRSAERPGRWRHIVRALDSADRSASHFGCSNEPRRTFSPPAAPSKKSHAMHGIFIAECDFGGIVEIGGILPSLPLPLGASPFPASATGSGKGLSNPD